MSTNIVIALVAIAQKPGASVSTSLITTRRICRVFGERADSIHLERRAMRRKANKLRQYLPFTASAMADIEQVAAKHRSAEWDDLHKVLTDFGRSLVLDTEGLAAGLGFDRLCVLLAINTVERETARTGRKFAPRFARLVRTLLRETGANQAASLLSNVMVARHWFPLRFPEFCSGFHWQLSYSRNNRPCDLIKPAPALGPALL